MRRVITEEEHATELYSSDAMDIRVAKHHDGYRIWINEAEKGLLVRAYRVKQVAIHMDDATREALDERQL